MFDAHSHALGVPRRDAAHAAGIRGSVLAGLGPSDWPGLATASAGGGWVAGLHPWWVDSASPLDVAAGLTSLEARLVLGGPVGVGECGLDHARARTSGARARQLAALAAQLTLACTHDRPVVLHVVRATGAALAAVRAARLPRGGLLHGFTGPLEVAREWHRLGFMLGVGPAVHHSARLRAALPQLPSESLVVESDDADPAQTLPGVVAALAALRAEDPADTARYTAANARRLFGLPIGSG